MKQLRVAAAFLLLLLAGCDKKDGHVLLFSHFLHVEDNEMACADCHGEILDGGFARPGHDACVDCHDDLIETETISRETCGVCHAEKDLRRVDGADKPARSAEGAFVHTATLGTMCADCHGDILAEGLERVPVMDRADVVRLRQRAHAGGKPCETCHVGVSPDVMPPDHDRNWVRRHGLRADLDDAVCGVCHQEETCRECHESTMPSSHNTLWRTRTHGIEASWDRANCRLCHEEDFCVACHTETRPRSHGPGWDQRHCTRCHSSASMGTGCATCHPGDIHAHPDPHPAGWLNRHCDRCHPGTPEGEQCNLCHPGGLDAHPDPHGAGWLNRHCDRCHPGTPEGEQCGVCHRGVDSHPDPHGAGWLNRHCDSCHPGTPEGDQCAICHRGGAETHPDPHGAGWLARHCDNCHPGTPEAEQCAICHPGGLDAHPDPHNPLWLGNHCGVCHAAGGSLDCTPCHQQGSVVDLHDDEWPAWHDDDGFDEQTDCFARGCHR